MTPKKDAPTDEGPWGPLLDILDDVRDTGSVPPTAADDEDAVAEWIDKEVIELNGDA